MLIPPNGQSGLCNAMPTNFINFLSRYIKNLWEFINKQAKVSFYPQISQKVLKLWSEISAEDSARLSIGWHKGLLLISHIITRKKWHFTTQKVYILWSWNFCAYKYHQLLMRRHSEVFFWDMGDWNSLTLVGVANIA